MTGFNRNIFFRFNTPGFVYTVAAILLLSSCSNTKYLKEGELLYTGASVKVVSGKTVKGRKDIVNTTEEDIKAKPNKKILGLRAKLWFYNIAGNPKKKGFRKFVKYKLGEPPVLFTDVDPGKTREQMDITMFNNGYFRSYAAFELKNNGRKVDVQYQLFLTEPYLIDSIMFDPGDEMIQLTIRESLKKTLLNRNRIYNLELIKTEKERIDRFLKDKGYYYFNPDYLLFEADTTAGNNKVNLKLKIKDITPYEALLVYRINDVYINTSYSVGSDSVAFSRDTIAGYPYYYHSSNDDFRKRPIARAVFLKNSTIYSRKNHNATLGQLMGMGTFKFVNVRFAEEDSTALGFLNSYVNLTPLPKRSMQFEVEVKSKSNNFIGPGFRISYRNRNIFKGAELFLFNLHTSFEAQFGGGAKGLNSFEIGPEIELQIPRFVTPFKVKNPTGYYVPKTKIAIGHNYLRRKNYFNLNSIVFSYGYLWKESQLKSHELSPIVVNYLRVSDKSPEFEQQLEDNVLLQKSFEEQFIAGLNYRYSYNELLVPDKKNQFYFHGNLETSGNLLYLVNRTSNKQEHSSSVPYEIAGEIYAQFLRVETDFRNYYNISETTKLVARLYAGVGVAYGNSVTLPYISQFFSGGATSIRAFRVRSVGPGTFRNEDVQTSFYDQGGDFKLEGNLEYRYRISGMFRGAFFIDAGNIWLLKDNPAVPGGKLTKDFINEIAVGGGLGLRLDANFFVLRLDLAVPFRKPWLPDGEKWVVSEVFGSGAFKDDNMILNIAIGYPF